MGVRVCGATSTANPCSSFVANYNSRRGNRISRLLQLLLSRLVCEGEAWDLNPTSSIHARNACSAGCKLHGWLWMDPGPARPRSTPPRPAIAHRRHRRSPGRAPSRAGRRTRRPPARRPPRSAPTRFGPHRLDQRGQLPQAGQVVQGRAAAERVELATAYVSSWPRASSSSPSLLSEISIPLSAPQHGRDLVPTGPRQHRWLAHSVTQGRVASDQACRGCTMVENQGIPIPG